MSREESIGAFILAGGKSSRMGKPKGLLSFAGRPLILRMTYILGFVPEGPVIIGEPSAYSALGFRVIGDDHTNLGPLGGICTALRVTSHEWNLILGCDLPFLTREWLKFLIARALDSAADVVIPLNERGYEPLCAMYRQRAHASIEAALARGVRKVTDGLAELALTTIEPSEWKAFDPRGTLFKNINTPADYEQACAAAKAEIDAEAEA